MNKGRVWRWVFLALAIFSVLLMVGRASGILEIPGFVVQENFYDVSDASSVGIIGGADGPTAIFVTKFHTPLGWALRWVPYLSLAYGALVGFLLLGWGASKKPGVYVGLSISSFVAALLGVVFGETLFLLPFLPFFEIVLAGASVILPLVMGIISLRYRKRARAQSKEQAEL